MLFLGIFTRVANAQQRMAEMEAALHAVHVERSLLCAYVPIEVGETVWVRYMPTVGDAWLRATGDVVAEADGGVIVRWGEGHGPMRGSETFLSGVASDVEQVPEPRVPNGGIIARQAHLARGGVGH